MTNYNLIMINIQKDIPLESMSNERLEESIDEIDDMIDDLMTQKRNLQIVVGNRA